MKRSDLEPAPEGLRKSILEESRAFVEGVGMFSQSVEHATSALAEYRLNELGWTLYPL